VKNKEIMGNHEIERLKDDGIKCKSMLPILMLFPGNPVSSANKTYRHDEK
jgi:hypothetical protein